MEPSAIMFEGSTDPETLEARACDAALIMSKDIIAHRIIIATDCQQVMRSMQARTNSAYAHIPHEGTKRLLKFESAKIVYEHRPTNHESHSLGRCSLYKAVERQVWLIHPPEVVNIPLILRLVCLIVKLTTQKNVSKAGTLSFNQYAQTTPTTIPSHIHWLALLTWICSFCLTRV